ncbi:MAG: transposase, partial [Armatimonadetes bacterium]|nr:transposase [Armatimonadota bacterium]
MCIQGVSTRRVKKVAEQLCGDGFSASTVSRLAKKLDADLEKFARRRLEEQYAYSILDARLEKVQVDEVVQSQAVQVAIGMNMEGRRRVLGIELAGRETKSSWRDSLYCRVAAFSRADSTRHQQEWIAPAL